MGTKQKKIITFLLAINVACLMMGTAVSAEEAGNSKKNNNIQVKVGFFEPTGEADDVGYDTGGDITLAYNRYLTDALVLEGALSIFGTSMDVDGNSGTAGSYSEDNCLGATALLVTLKGEYPVGPVDLFAGAGVGYYAAFLDAEIDTDNRGSFDLDDTDTVFGAHVVAGANYNITDRFFLGLEGSYRWTDDLELSDSNGSIPANFDGDLSGLTVSLAAGFRF